jgi:hypothetical protein
MFVALMMIDGNQVLDPSFPRRESLVMFSMDVNSYRMFSKLRQIWRIDEYLHGQIVQSIYKDLTHSCKRLYLPIVALSDAMHR